MASAIHPQVCAVAFLVVLLKGSQVFLYPRLSEKREGEIQGKKAECFKEKKKVKGYVSLLCQMAENSSL